MFRFARSRVRNLLDKSGEILLTNLLCVTQARQKVRKLYAISEDNYLNFRLQCVAQQEYLPLELTLRGTKQNATSSLSTRFLIGYKLIKDLF